MADPTVRTGVTTWVTKGRMETTWANLVVTTTGDMGSPEDAYPGCNIMSVYVTGTMASDTTLQFQESNAASMAFAVGQTVCGTALSFGSATNTLLTTGVVYMVRPGAQVFKPRITAGASAAEDLTVIYVQAKV